MEDILNLIQKKPELLKINESRNLPHNESSAPAYWFTKAYIRDMVNDVLTLGGKCLEFEKDDSYEDLCSYYKEMKNLVEELLERAKYFHENNK